MTISVVNASGATQGVLAASVSSSGTFTSTSANLLVGVTASDSTATDSGTPPVADGGTNTWTYAKSSASTQGDYCGIAYAKNITGQAGEALVYSLNGLGYPDACLIEVSGCDTSSPVDVAPTFAASTGVGVSSLNTPAITPTAGQRLLVVAGDGGNGGALTITDNGTAAATWTTIANSSGTGQPFLLAYSIVTADGSHNYSATYNRAGAVGGAACGIAAFKIASGGPVALTGAAVAQALATASPTVLFSGASAAQATATATLAGTVQLIGAAIAQALAAASPTVLLTGAANGVATVAGTIVALLPAGNATAQAVVAGALVVGLAGAAVAQAQAIATLTGGAANAIRQFLMLLGVS